ncbi:hypothetical protein ACI3ER_11590 [Bacillus sp. Wb]
MYIPYEIDELAELTATGIMGWTLDKEYGFWETGDGDLDVESEWNPATVEKDAEMLVHKIANDKNMKLTLTLHNTVPNMTQAIFSPFDIKQSNNKQFDAYDTNPYRAMCLAALKVYGLKLG